MSKLSIWDILGYKEQTMSENLEQKMVREYRRIEALYITAKRHHLRDTMLHMLIAMNTLAGVLGYEPKTTND